MANLEVVKTYSLGLLGCTIGIAGLQLLLILPLFVIDRLVASLGLWPNVGLWPNATLLNAVTASLLGVPVTVVGGKIYEIAGEPFEAP